MSAMKPVLVFRHLACEGPGYLADVFKREHIPFEVIPLDEGAGVPESIDKASGLVMMGGPMSVNDPLKWIDQECELIRQAVHRNLPVIGHCLGGQLISKALGGQITANPVKEIGWLAVEMWPDGRNTPWLRGLPARFEAFHWHGETFSLPPGATPLLRSEHCENQAFAYGSALALQFHVEMTAAMVREWAQVHGAEIAVPSETVQSEAQLCERLDARIAALNQCADALYAPFLQRLRRLH
jgi:GMP synthase-like glutamine amidotransferase